MKAKGLVAAVSVVLSLHAIGLANENIVELDTLEFGAAEQANDVDFVETGYLSDSLNYAARNFTCSFVSGAEFTFLDIEARSGGRITMSFDDSGTAGTDLATRDGNGVDDEGYSPRVWLGLQFCEEWAIVGRFWNLDDSENGRPDLVPGTVELTNFATEHDSNRVEAYTLDIEAVRTFEFGQWKLDGVIGARQASLDVDSRVTAFGVFTTGNFVNLDLRNGSNFDGTGVTYGGVVRRRVLSSPVYLFVSARGTTMNGYTNSYGGVAGSVADSPSAPLVGAATVRRNGADSDMTIGELQAGVQLEFALRRLPANAFFRAAYEYQNWDIDGPPTGGAGFGGTIGTLTTNSFSTAGLGGLELHGLSLASGFTW
jgi:hypothetical protein